jgi:hypothetical protein
VPIKELSSRESLLRKDLDGRWWRHILPSDLVEANVQAINRVCSIFNVQSAGYGVATALRACAQAAENVRDGKNKEAQAEAGLRASTERLHALNVRYTVLRGAGLLGRLSEGEDDSAYGWEGEGEEEGGNDAAKELSDESLEAGIALLRFPQLLTLALL